MVNALVHRDYGVLGSEIHIDIFDDRIEIQNPGGMYDGVPVQNQDLENIISTRRNPVIADLMNRMDFMERRGSGFRKILAAVKFAPNYREENLPVFKSTPFSFTAIIKNLNFGIETNVENEVKNKDFEKNGLKSQKWPEKWPEKCQKIINAISDNKYVTIEELVKLLDTGHTTVKKMIAELQKEKYIYRNGADNGGFWEILQ